VECSIHLTKHGSNYRAIRTAFNVTLPKRIVMHRLLLKNLPWIIISARLENNF
jgi:hypothetical protein